MLFRLDCNRWPKEYLFFLANLSEGLHSFLALRISSQGAQTY